MLNINHPETEQAVRELSERLEVSFTEAITVAVRHELQQLDDNRDGYIRRLANAAQQVRAERNPEDWLSDEALYNANGLPQ